MPFFPDQALFTIYARETTHGAVLYRDLFDIKQPGIYGFYAVAGLMCGFTEVGIHAFELAYWIAFSAIASVMLRPYFLTRWGSTLVSTFTVAVYYLWADLPDLTQIEILVGFPLLVSWCVTERAHAGTSRGRRAYAIAGILTAGIVLLKYLYLIIVLAMVARVVRRDLRSGVARADISRCALAFGVSVLVPLAVVAAYFAVHGQLERIWWIYFQYVPNSQLIGTKSVSFFKVGLRRFLIGHGPVVVLAALGCLRLIVARDGRRRELMAAMVGWCICGSVALAVQGWWEYKWELFTVPLGVLGALAAETLVVQDVTTLTRRAWGAVGALGVAATGVGLAGGPRVHTWLLISVATGMAAAIVSESPITRERLRRPMRSVFVASVLVSGGLAAVAPVLKLRALIAHGLAADPEARRRYQHSLSDAYAAADSDLARLTRQNVVPDSLYVFGNPVLLLRAGLPPPVPFLGQAPDSYDTRAWQELDRSLRSARPSYIVIDDYSEPIIRSRYPAILRWIQSRYRVVLDGASGTWHARR